MKKYLFFALALGVSSSALATDSYVHGYAKKDGTYVNGYHRTAPDNTVNNNYGTSGNVNPYSGREGTQPRNPYQGQGNYNLGNGAGTKPNYDDNNDGRSDD